MVVNDIFDLVKIRKDKCLLLNIDFEKAYDIINKNFLTNMISTMRFKSTIISWMKKYICKSSMPFFVNGVPMKDFRVGKRLRQRDPITAFIFSIVAECLTILTNRALEFRISNNKKVHKTL